MSLIIKTKNDMNKSFNVNERELCGDIEKVNIVDAEVQLAIKDLD